MKLIQGLLEAEGYSVLPAKDGVEVVKLYGRYKNHIALLILDIRMPKLNGWDAFQDMKKQDQQLRVLVATAYAAPEIRSAMAKEELHGLFIKPYPGGAFLARVSELIRTCVIAVPLSYSVAE